MNEFEVKIYIWDWVLILGKMVKVGIKYWKWIIFEKNVYVKVNIWIMNWSECICFYNKK